ncbi:hypothetical protein JQX13_43125 [Archangium violaceum]|uniref:hypothetical protein n=1 Tax=Archangium violaceum TaxID=83451 RepID=UPI00193C2A29|nr:hypothetical protein [Archangium violaceum]QRK06790.1 hypothetical protein JQX13_43125 [Archangium violaceum]
MSTPDWMDRTRAVRPGEELDVSWLLSGLLPVYPKVPRPLVLCGENESPMGVTFYVMERVRGVIIRAKPPKGLELTPELMRKLSENFVDNLVDLHAVDWRAAELGKPEGYLGRQVAGWTERYGARRRRTTSPRWSRWRSGWPDTSRRSWRRR